jgi:glycosyltransferase involved in cell wall biosynthesis
LGEFSLNFSAGGTTTKDKAKKHPVVTKPEIYRLAVVASHPVQYQAPLFQLLARNPALDLTVYYGNDSSLAGEVDPGFGVPVRWDRPLLAGYRSEFLSYSAERVGKLKKFTRPAHIIKELKKDRYDAVLINDYSSSESLFAYIGAWLSRTPVLLKTESELFKPRRWQVKLFKKLILSWLIKGTAAFLTIGKANRAFYTSFGVKPEKMFDTPYSVDNDFFTGLAASLDAERGALKQQLGFAPDRPLIIFSAKLIERKRPMDLLEAYKSLTGQGLEAGLLFIGEGGLRPEMEAFIARHGLDRVKITGFKNQMELPALYASGDIFVLPSRFDTWGLVVNEAMLFGMPVIVTDMVGAGQDLVEPDVTGHVYPVGDIASLAGLLEGLIKDPEKRARMGRAAQEHITRWNYKTCEQGILQALQAVRAGR